MTGNCSVDFEATTQGKTTFQLYDISGKRILHKQELLKKGQHTYSLKGIKSGIYILKVESDNYSYSAKIVSSNLSKDITEIKHIETNQGAIKQCTDSNILPTKKLKAMGGI